MTSDDPVPAAATDQQPLKVGSFYWVRPALDPDSEDWEQQRQPARYAGVSAEGVDLWNYLGEDGASPWPVIWVGSEIMKP